MGGVVAGVLFVLPSLFILVALSWIYVTLGDTPLVAGLLYGIKPAVTAIVLQAAWRIGSRSLRNNLLRAVAVAAFLAIFVLHLPFPAIVLGAATEWLMRAVLPIASDVLLHGTIRAAFLGASFAGVAAAANPRAAA